MEEALFEVCGKLRNKRPHMMRRCVNPPQVNKVGGVMHNLESWEQNVRHLHSDFKEVLSEGLKAGILVGMAPQQNN